MSTSVTRFMMWLCFSVSASYVASSPREHKLHQYLLKDPLAEGTAGLLDVSW